MQTSLDAPGHTEPTRRRSTDCVDQARPTGPSARVAEAWVRRAQCVDQIRESLRRRSAAPRCVDNESFRARRAQLRRATPLDYPARPGSSKALSSIWIGEALVDSSGTVREVWTIRPLSFNPAWPEFEAAIPAAIRKWSYEPAVVDGTAVPVCVTVSVRIRWS